jgi:hypothetical protein
MAVYGTGYGSGLAPWWQGSTNQFMGRQGSLGREPSELDVRKVLDAVSKQRDFSNIGGGMLAATQQSTPLASAPMQPMVMPSGYLRSEPNSMMNPSAYPSGGTMPVAQTGGTLDYGVPIAQTGGTMPVAQTGGTLDYGQPGYGATAPPGTQMNNNMGGLDQPMTSTLMPSTQPMTPSVMPVAQPAAPMPQENMLNQNFMQLLQGLGLNNLFQSFQPQSAQPNQMNMFGPAPLFSNSGLFNSIY